MRPSVPVVLNAAISQLTARVKTVSDPHQASELSGLARGLQAVVKDYDECATRRVAEIKILSGLLAQGAGLAGERFSWRDDLIANPYDDLRISALDARLDLLKTRLIELQAWLEEESSEESAALLTEIFEFEHQCASDSPKAPHPTYRMYRRS